MRLPAWLIDGCFNRFERAIAYVRVCVCVCFLFFFKKKTIPEKKRLSQTSPYRLIATMLAQASIIEVLKERTR
jgi:hypothetical protein